MNFIDIWENIKTDFIITVANSKLWYINSSIIFAVK